MQWFRSILLLVLFLVLSGGCATRTPVGPAPGAPSGGPQGAPSRPPAPPPTLASVLDRIATSQRRAGSRLLVIAPGDKRGKGVTLGNDRAVSARDYLVG